MEGWGIIGGAPSEGSAKVAIKARLPNSFVGKETKTKKSATIVTPSGSVHGNSTPQIRQGTNSFCSDSPHRACVGLVDVLNTKKPDLLKTLT